MAASEHLSPDQFPGLHRGVMLSMSNEDIREHLDQGGVPALHAEIARRVQVGDKGSPGRHWTSDRAVAEKFSHRYMREPRTHLDYWQTHIPVVMHGHVDPAHIETSAHEHGMAMVGHQGRQESETLLKRGAPVQVRHIEAALPHGDWRSGWEQHSEMEHEGDMIRSWSKVPHAWRHVS